MHANLLGLAAAVLSLVIFKGAYDRLRQRSPSVKAAWLGVGLLLSVPAVLSGVYYLHVLPEWEWFYTFRSWAGTEFLAVFLGVAAGAFAALLPRWLLILPLFAMMALAAIPYVKPVLAPLKDEAFHNRTQGEYILQSTSATCGPSSVCNALHQLGVSATEYEIARSAHTYAGGTEAWYLARAIRAKGLAPRFFIRETFDPNVGLPAIVGVRLSGLGHFIAVLKVEDNFATFVDPAWGAARVSLDELHRRFDFTGFHMVITMR
jgi:hypothetical protein